jgi:hypothetical protein
LLGEPGFENMSRPARSLFVFGIYLCGLGLILLFVPNAILRVFGAPPTNEVWIRINGMFLLCLSFYYVQTARKELTVFIRWTVWARIAVIFYFAAFVLLVSAPKALLLFGLIDLLSAMWTWFALKKHVVANPKRRVEQIVGPER